jgi:hypothetical protein
VLLLPQQRDHACLVARQEVEDGIGRRPGRFQHQAVAVHMQADASVAGGFQGFRRTHSRALQSPVPFFSGTD